MIPDQQPLVKVAKPLSDRQQAAWDHVRAHQGVTAEQVGAHLHQWRGKHPADQQCEWCRREGLGVLNSKALKPLVTYRRTSQGRLYIARDPADRLAERDMGHIPF